MRSSDLRARLLAVIGATTLASAGVAACGSDTTASSTPADDAADERTDANARGDGRGDELLVGPDASLPETGPFDSGGDETPPSPRRPFLIGSSLGRTRRSAPSAPRDDWADSRIDTAPAVGLDATTSHELAKAWLADALEEHASIAAFARFTMLMLSVGAPPELVVAAQRASIDEVAHARDCFALARRYGANAAGPGALDVHDAMPPMSLADLAALTAEEGCVGETLGAALAAEQLAGAVDAEVRRILGRIVRDEARHAELAWRFVAWAVGEERRGSPGSAGVAAAVTRAIHRATSETRAMVIRPCLAELAAWRAHGRLTCAEAREASERTLVELILPCLEGLRLAPLEAEPIRSGASERRACSSLPG